MRHRVMIGCIAVFYGYTAMSINRTQVGNSKLQLELADAYSSTEVTPSPKSSQEDQQVVNRHVVKSSFINGITKETEFLQISEPCALEWEQRTGITVPSSTPVLTTLQNTLSRLSALKTRSNTSLAHSATPPSSQASGRPFRFRVSQVTTNITTSMGPIRPSSSRTNRGAHTYQLVAISVFCALLTVWVHHSSFSSL
jgi:hypothetical protein